MFNELLNNINIVLKQNNLFKLEDFLSKWYKNNLWYGKILNYLLNYNKINNPKQTLYLGATVRDFFKQNKKYKYEIENNLFEVFNNFYNYVNAILLKKWNNLENIINKFYNIIRNTNEFNNIEDEIIYNISFFYIYKLFIYSSITWILNEVKIINKINNWLENNWLKNIYIHDDISWYEDNKFCIDFSIKNNTKFILWIQVKPLSFILWLNSTTNYSYNKILKANNDLNNYLKWEEWIFIFYFWEDWYIYFFHIENPNKKFLLESLYTALNKYNY